GIEGLPLDRANRFTPDRELVQVDLSEDDCTRAAQFLSNCRIGDGSVSRQTERAARRRHVIRVDIVFQQHWDSMERADELPGPAEMFIQRGRLFQGPRIEKDHHIELRARLVASPDALQISLHQPYGGESAGLVRRVHIADRGLIEMKWFD